MGEIFSTYLKIDEEQRCAIVCAELTANISILKLQTLLHQQPGTLLAQQKNRDAVTPAAQCRNIRRPGIISPRGGPQAHPFRRDCKQQGLRIREIYSLDKGIPLNLQRLWNYH